jgi:hypothetical protein
MFLIDYRAICVILCAPKSSHACPSLSPSPASKDQPGSGSSKTAVRHAPICAPRRRQACIACLGRRAVTSNRAYNCQYETCSATSPPRRGFSSPFNYLPEGTVEDGSEALINSSPSNAATAPAATFRTKYLLTAILPMRDGQCRPTTRSKPVVNINPFGNHPESRRGDN